MRKTIGRLSLQLSTKKVHSITSSCEIQASRPQFTVAAKCLLIHAYQQAANIYRIANTLCIAKWLGQRPLTRRSPLLPFLSRAALLPPVPLTRRSLSSRSSHAPLSFLSFLFHGRSHLPFLSRAALLSSVPVMQPLFSPPFLSRTALLPPVPLTRRSLSSRSSYTAVLPFRSRAALLHPFLSRSRSAPSGSSHEAALLSSVPLTRPSDVRRRTWRRAAEVESGVRRAEDGGQRTEDGGLGSGMMNP